MKILYVVVDKSKAEINKETKKSISDILVKGDSSVFKQIDDTENYSELTAEKYDFVCVVPNGSTLSPIFRKMAETYVDELSTDTVYLPLVVLQSEKTTGVLNTCLWNHNLAGVVGELDFELAQKQIDLTLFGALIPTKYLVAENFNTEVKYYQHFYFLNMLTKKEVFVKGIPKTLLTTDFDLSYSEIPSEEKVKNFNLAKEVKFEKEVKFAPMSVA